MIKHVGWRNIEMDNEFVQFIQKLTAQARQEAREEFAKKLKTKLRDIGEIYSSAYGVTEKELANTRGLPNG